MGSYMSVSEKKVGQIHHDFDIEIFTWTIPNASSLLEYSVGNFVQSPPFSCFGAHWILKMYPCGQEKYETKESFDVVIERLHSNIEWHHLIMYLYFRNKFGTEIDHAGNIGGRFCPESTLQTIISHVNGLDTEQSLKFFYEKELLELNDTLILMLKLVNLSNSSNIQDSQSESAVSEIDAVNRNQGIGELFKEYLDFKNFTWWIREDIPSYQLPTNFEAQSPPFSFAKATWVLKLYPYYRIKPHNSSFDVLLQRLHSEIEEHFVKYKIILEVPERKVTEQASVFTNSCTKGDVIHFKLLASSIPVMDIMSFEIEMEMKSDIGIKFHSQIELNKSAVELFPQKEECDNASNTLAAA